MSDVIGAVQEVFYALFQGYCLQYFMEAFLESRFAKQKWSGFMAAILFGVIKIGLRLRPPSNDASVEILKKQIALFLILFVLTFCFYQAFHIITVFLVITFMAVSEISFFLAYLVMEFGSLLFEFWNWCVGQAYITSVETFEYVIKGTMIGLYILMYLSFCVIFYFALKKIVKSYREKDYVIHRTELLFILTPGLVGWLICLLLRIIIITVENGILNFWYDKYPVLLLIVLAILLLSLLSIVYGVKLFQDMIYFNREKNSRIILENQIGSMQEHMTEMERIFSGIRSMKHDMKNTLSVIMQLSAGNEEKEQEELQDYLSELNQTMDRLEFQFRTGNAVIDTLLNMKYHEAIKAIPDIRMDAEWLLFSESLLIQSYDIGIILGNALDNAIEACRKLKEKEPEAETFIRLSSVQKGNMILIEIENSFDGTVIRKRQSEFPVTDKADKEAHGIGFSNIKKAAENYHGAVDWSVDHKVFLLSVMLQNEKSRGG